MHYIDSQYMELTCLKYVFKEDVLLPLPMIEHSSS